MNSPTARYARAVVSSSRCATSGCRVVRGGRRSTRLRRVGPSPRRARAGTPARVLAHGRLHRDPGRQDRRRLPGSTRVARNRRRSARARPMRARRPRGARRARRRRSRRLWIGGPDHCRASPARPNRRPRRSASTISSAVKPRPSRYSISAARSRALAIPAASSASKSTTSLLQAARGGCMSKVVTGASKPLSVKGSCGIAFQPGSASRISDEARICPGDAAATNRAAKFTALPK